MAFAKKRFGQNFLQDASVIENIVNALAASANDTVVEIGPGRGALTTVLLQRLNQLHVIEIDKDLYANLKDLPHAERLNAICQDALTVDFSSFGNNLRVIGNLPYNISTPLLFHLLSYRASIIDMLFMLQSEVVDRITARPGDTDFGRLSVMFQYYCEVERVLDVPPECFNPIPKVQSAVVSLRPKKLKETISFDVLENIVAKAFAMRRKTLSNNFRDMFTEADWAQMGISSKKRAQELNIEDFVTMADYSTKMK